MGYLRKKMSMPLFVSGLSLVWAGIGWEVTAMWVVGLIVFVAGIGLVAWRKR